MESVIEKIAHTASDALKSASEIAKERIFTPMYFYFLGAWIITNWKFVYVLLLADEHVILGTKGILKVDYLAQMYGFNFNSALHLVIIPIITSYLIVWWLSIVSEKFYQRHEEHQMNKRAIKRLVEYREKVLFFKSQREIREQQLDDAIKYEDNREYNDQINASNPEVQVNGVPMLPSEVLYKTDYLAYKTGLDEYLGEQAEIGEDIAVQAEIDRRRGK